MKIFPAKKNGSRGHTLFIIIVITGLVGFVLAAYLTLLRSQNTTTMRSQAWNASIPVVEAGIEDAMSHLNAHGTTNLGCDGWTQSGNIYYTPARYLGQNYYVLVISNWFAGMTNLPVIESRGFVSVPTLTASASHPFLASGAGSPAATTNYLGRGVRCSTRQEFLFTKAMVAKGNINLSGNNVRTDSFDSGNTNYSTNGRWDSSKARAKGDVATDGVVTNTLSIGNANIFGRVSTGPNGTIALGINGMVGDTTFQSNPANKGKIEPGWSTDDMNVDFPDVIPPFTAAPPPAPLVVGGVSYNYVLSSGNWAIVSGTFGGKVLVTGNASLYVGPLASIKFSGSDVITIQTNASLNLYGDTANVDISGQGVQNPGFANQFYYWGTARNTTLSYGGNSAFTGVFYAPYADFSLGGGGNSTIDFSGSSISKTIKMNGNYNFHYDEALGRGGKIRGFVVTSWNEMTPQEVATLPATIGTIVDGVLSLRQ